MEKANVTWMGKENQSEIEIDIKDPKAEAKRIDDYMNNEVDYDSLEEALTSQVRRVQFRGKTAAFQAVVTGSNPVTRFGIGPIRRIPFAVQTVGKTTKKNAQKISAENVNIKLLIKING